MEETKRKFEESIKIARKAGVAEKDILKSKEDIDDFFLGKDINKTNKETKECQ